MKIILQKVKKASVSVNNKVVGSIDKGYCLLVGVHKESIEEDAKYLAKKILNLLYMQILRKVIDLVLQALQEQKKQMNYMKNLMNF